MYSRVGREAQAVLWLGVVVKDWDEEGLFPKEEWMNVTEREQSGDAVLSRASLYKVRCLPRKGDAWKAGRRTAFEETGLSIS